MPFLWIRRWIRVMVFNNVILIFHICYNIVGTRFLIILFRWKVGIVMMESANIATIHFWIVFKNNAKSPSSIRNCSQTVRSRINIRFNSSKP